MEYINIEKCTRCNEIFTDLKFFIKLHIESARKTNVDSWEKINNLDVDSHEVVCKNCFDKFCLNIEHMNGEQSV